MKTKPSTSITVPRSQLPTANNTPTKPYNLDTLAIPTTSFNLPLLPTPPITATSRLSANMEIQSFMPDHADFVSYYARHAAHKRNMPAQQVIHLPTIIKKWHVTKGPFVHDKSKEVFEQKTYRRLIQVFDADQEVVKEWYTHVNQHLPSGIDMKIDTFTPLPLETLASQITALEQTVAQEQADRVKRLESTLGPEEAAKVQAGEASAKHEMTYEEDVRARADEFIRKATAGAGGKAKGGKGKQ
ncbi:mitochondrial 37S ribosomal protein rsm10 [Podochytrium sp. JEL0797]|nr:mitochondrial 37S ribosomal protein rsm10 [Podochytrium sp. JEL0797]